MRGSLFLPSFQALAYNVGRGDGDVGMCHLGIFVEIDILWGYRFEFINLSIRAFQVSALWNIFSAMFGLSVLLNLLGQRIFRFIAFFALVLSYYHDTRKAVTMTIMHSPTSLLIWFIGTRPMSIMVKRL